MDRTSAPARGIALALVGLFLMASIGSVLGAVAGGATHLALVGPRLRPAGTSATNSTNWAGYAVTASSGTVSDVKGSWIVPKIQGTCPSRSDQYSSFWIGIDGYTSKTVEQIGTDSDCQGGSPTYYAWYEFYPAGSVGLGMSISPGDTISAQVQFHSSKYTVSIKDVTTGASFSHSHRMSASRSSAEWIAEAPSSGGILPLADFGVADLGTAYTSVASTDVATISGTTHPIGGFSGVVALTMVNTAGTAVKASPSGLNSAGNSFTVTWKSAGP